MLLQLVLGIDLVFPCLVGWVVSDLSVNSRVGVLDVTRLLVLVISLSCVCIGSWLSLSSVVSPCVWSFIVVFLIPSLYYISLSAFARNSQIDSPLNIEAEGIANES